MSNDVELNDVKDPLMGNEKQSDIPEVDFKSSNKDLSLVKKDEEFRGLTKEELEKFANDPFWKRLRLILFILFWVVWAGMLIAAILIVVFSPKCPKRPKLQFWQQKTGYWLDPYAYADSNNDNVGDFKGIMNKLDYISKQLGAGYIILDPIFKGQYSQDGSIIGSVESFADVDPILGTKASFIELVKEARKRGIEIIVTADFNALSSRSEFLKKNKDIALIKWDNNKFSEWLDRNGNLPKRNFEGQEVYSALANTDLLELNLRNDLVLKEIKDSVKMWLNDAGVRGFLLTNVGMYVENSTFPAVNTNYNLNNTWYQKQSINGQIYSNETRMFLKEIRDVMNEVAKKTDKSRLLIVDAGDIGFGLEKEDYLLKYLDEKENLADMIIGREFLRNRGWKTDMSKMSSVETYLSMNPSTTRKRVGLTSATSTSVRTTELLKLAAPFLLEGSPILYFGSELGINCDFKTIDSLVVPFYPQNRKFPVLVGELPVKCNHMIMPWDNNGKGFYNGGNSTDAYLTEATVTVESLTAIGISETILQLHQKLIKIRKEPSLQWGSVEMIFNEKSDYHSYEIFTRKAEGFPVVIVALLKHSTKDGKVFSFTSVCEKFVPIFIYPSNSNLEENKEVNTKNVYLQILKSESVHVFKCVP